VQDIVLNTGITDLKNYEITWSTGDTVGRITVNESGLYTVVVRDKHCDYEHTDQSAVNFLGSGTPYFVPNAFTPNMDDTNDVFKPFVPFTDIDSYKIVIYNRWGEQVFSSEDPKQAWDGKRNGKPAEKGVYIWHCTVRTSCLKDQLHHQRGTLTILR
jgi:gliding motility-associated-like protein